MLELDGRLSIGASPSQAAQMAARQEGENWRNRGYDVVYHDLPCPVQGAWAVKEHRCRWGIFWESVEGRLKRHCFDRYGIRIKELPEQELFTNRRGFVEEKSLPGESWARQTAKEGVFGLRLRRPKVCVEGTQPLKGALEQVLKVSGCCRVEERWSAGVAAFWLERGGFYLMARDERGAVVDSGQLLGVVTLIEMENGGRRVALPSWSSVAPRLVAAGYRGEVLDVEEPEGRALYGGLPWLREGSAAAVRIVSRMAASGQSLEKLVANTPRFQQWKRESRLEWDRDRVLENLRGYGRLRSEGTGFQLRVGQNWLHVRPIRAGWVQVVAEGADLEAAEELCDICLGRLTGRE